MKKMLYRFLYTLLLLFLALPLLLAAGQRQASVTIDWWVLSTMDTGIDPRIELNNHLIDEFQSRHPHVRINMVPMGTEELKKAVYEAVSEGRPPDLFHSWGGYVMFEYAQRGALRDITYFVKTNLEQQINQEALNLYAHAGSYFGAPFDLGGVVFFYNRHLFDTAGASIPETWPEFLDTVQQLKAAGITPIALGAADRWPAHFWWVYLAIRIGGKEAFDRAYSGDGSFQDPPFVLAGETLLELKNLQPFQEGFLHHGYRDQARLMGDGLAAMELMGQWAESVARNLSQTGEGLEKLEIFPFPAMKDMAGRSTDIMGGGNGYLVGANAPDETLDFLLFLLSTDVQKRQMQVFNIIPVNTSITSLESKNASRIRDVITNTSYFQLYYDQFFPLAVGEAVKNASLQLLQGSLTAEEAAGMIQLAWQQSTAP